MVDNQMMYAITNV